GLVKGIVDANLSVDTRNAVADRLYEAVDQSGLEVRSGGGIDASAGNEAVHLGAIEGLRPLFARIRSFDQRERVGYPAPDILDAGLPGSRILLEKDILGDRLRRQRCCDPGC